jgi:hypothetical protein
MSKGFLLCLGSGTGTFGPARIKFWIRSLEPTSDVKSVTFSNFQSFFVTNNSLENLFLSNPFIHTFICHYLFGHVLGFDPTKCRESLGVGPGSRIYHFGSFQWFQFTPCEKKNIFAEISRKKDMSVMSDSNNVVEFLIGTYGT